MAIKSEDLKLPLGYNQFAWSEFEEFCCELCGLVALNAPGNATIAVQSSNLYESRGKSQHGIDGEVRYEDGSLTAFQCKRHKTWNLTNTKDAINKAEKEYPKADRYVLVVSQEVTSAKIWEEVDSHPKWKLWDRREISNRVLSLPDEQGVRLVGRWFGLEMARKFFGKDPALRILPLTTFYQRELTSEGRVFHHQAELVGRKSTLVELHEFVDSDLTLAILPGTGGSGKSRTLIEFSRQFGKRHPAKVLRMLVGDNELSDENFFGLGGKELVLVIEDAHTMNNIRSLSQIPSLYPNSVQLILATRPGAVQQIQTALSGSAIDVTEQRVLSTIPHLDREETLILCENLLDDSQQNHAGELAKISFDSPLIAVAGSKIINQGNSSDLLANNDNFRQEVFDRYEREQTKEVPEEVLPLSERKKLFKLVAALAPIDLDESGVIEDVASFIGMKEEEDALEQAIDSFLGAGQFVRVGRERRVRISPEILSDYLLFQACFKEDGQPSRFVSKISEAFPDNDRILWNLAKVDWLSVRSGSAQSTVFKGIWPLVLKRFRNSRFSDRVKMVNVFSETHLAAFAPDEAMELVQLALELFDQPELENRSVEADMADYIQGPSMWYYGRASQRDVLFALTGLIKDIAEYQPAKRRECLDLLWAVGKHGPENTGSYPSHPIRRIGELQQLGYRGIDDPTLYQHDVDRAREIGEWVCDLVEDEKEAKFAIKPMDLLPALFNRVGEQNWTEGQTFHMRSFLLPPKATEEVRKRALAILESLILGNDLRSALDAVKVVANQVSPISMGRVGLHAPDAGRATWEEIALNTGQLLAATMSKVSHPLLRLRIREALVRSRSYSGWLDSSPFQDLPGERPVDREFLITSVLYSSPHADEEAFDNYKTKLIAQQEFRSEVFEMLTKEHENHFKAFLELEKILAANLQDRISMSWGGRDFICEFGKSSAEDIEKICQHLTDFSAPLAEHFSFFVSLKQLSESKRSQLLERAAVSESVVLRKAVVRFLFWRTRDKPWSDAEYRLLIRLATDARADLVREFAHHIAVSKTDWSRTQALIPHLPNYDELLPELLKIFSPSFCQARGSENVADWLSDAVAGHLLEKLTIPLNLADRDILEFLSNAAFVSPSGVYNLLVARVELAESCEAPKGYSPLPYFESFRNDGLRDSEDYPEWLGDTARRATRKGLKTERYYWAELFQHMAGAHNEDSIAILRSFLDSPTEENIEAVFDLLGTAGWFVFREISFVKDLLTAAFSVSEETYQRAIDRLQIVGPRTRTYSGTKINPHDQHELDTATRLAEENRKIPELYELYSRIAGNAKRSIDYHRRRSNWL